MLKMYLTRVSSGKWTMWALVLLDVLKEDPFSTYLPYEKLVGELEGAYSKRINIQHRLVYQVYEEKKIIKVIRMWSHYG